MATKTLEVSPEYRLNTDQPRPAIPALDGRVVFMAYTTRSLARALAKTTDENNKKAWENDFVVNAARKSVDSLAQTVLATQPKLLGFHLSDPIRNTEGALGATKAMLTALNCLSAIVQTSLDVPSKQSIKREAKTNLWERFATTPPKPGKTFRGAYQTELKKVKKAHQEGSYNQWQEKINQKAEELHEQRSVLKEKLDSLKGGTK